MGVMLGARLYGPGCPSEGTPVTVTASTFGLSLEGEHARVMVPSWQNLPWRTGGFNDSQLFLEWPTDEGHFTLTVSDESAKTTLRGFLAKPNQKGSSPGATTRRWSMGLMIALIALPLLLLAAFLSQTDRIIDWAVAQIPVETEIALGRQAFAQQRQALAIADDHPALPMLRELGARITRGSPYPYEFHITRDPTVNAFAMPGGFVVFHTGLLEKADSAEEVAGVLAHEVQHVERRHGLRGLAHSAGWRITLSLVLGEAGGSMAAAWAENLGNLKFSRDQEAEADRLGLARLVANHIDPRGMLDFFRKMAREGDGMPALISSHPASEDRFAAIERAMPREAHYPTLPYDYAALKKDRR